MQHVGKNRIFRILVCMVLVAMLILPSGIVASAAAKPSVTAKMTIGTGSVVGTFDYYPKGIKYSLSVSNPVKNATYSFTSSNAKIVSVKASGAEALLTGLKAGTATITCNQKLSGKTTKVGACVVTVKNSSVVQDFIPVLPVGSSVSKEPLVFNYRNNDAVYTYTANNKNFTMKETLSTFDDMQFISHSFTAKAPGTYTVTVKETYNKVTRTVGTIKYTVKKATVYVQNTIDLGDRQWAFELMENYRTDVKYLFYSEDKEVVEVYSEGGTAYLKGKKVGTAILKIYENVQAPDESKLIGTCKISVKEVVLEDLECEFDEEEAYVGEDPIEFYVTKYPENAPGTITVTSSNPSVATVSELDEEGVGTITPVSAGTTVITITCGDIAKTQTITVYDEDEE